VHRLVEEPALRQAVDTFGRDAVMDSCRRAVDGLRRRVLDGELVDQDVDAACDALEHHILQDLADQARAAYPRVVNATGVILHTNLGRAPLPDAPASLTSYLALEYDLAAGERGQRLAPIVSRIAAVCGAEAAVMVNNNAAALFLMLFGHARDREVVVSRSQLIEIGGSFRLPDVMAASGSRLVEVGCTNRTHLHDYERALSDDTAAILVAHQSNFRIVGFTASPPLDALAELAHRHDLPLMVDQGSGCLHDLSRWGLPHEETVGEILAAGADLVCFSGDKLLGGPQAGLIVGAERWVAPLARHPLYRALRPDKSALVLMDRVLAAHHSGRLDRIPVYAMLGTSVETLRRRAARLGRRLRRLGVPVRGRATRSALGGGTTPEETMPSYGLGIDGGQRVLDALRAGDPPVIGRVEDDEVVLDLRTVAPSDDAVLETAIAAVFR